MRRLWFVILFSLTLVKTSCDSPSQPRVVEPQSSVETEILSHVGRKVIAPLAAQLSEDVTALRDSFAPGCEKPDTWSQAKAAWTKAMESMHRLSALPIGPLQDHNRSLHLGLYAWPYSAPCDTERAMLDLKNNASLTMTLPPQARDLSAVERLLFDDRFSPTCSARRFPEVHAWARLSDQEKLQDRCRLASHFAERLAERASVVSLAWSPSGADFTQELVNGKRYRRLHLAMNALSDALMNLETLKDQRLGGPLGRHRSCDQAPRPCLDMIEHPWSQLATKAMGWRLESFAKGYFGSELSPLQPEGLGLWVEKRGQAQVNARLYASYLSTKAQLSKVTDKGSLTDLIGQNDSDVAALHDELRGLSRVFRSEVLTLLGLREPPTAQGDND